MVSLPNLKGLEYVARTSAKSMNIEDYREFCLSLGEDIEEKLPFQKFKNGEGVLGCPPRDYQSRGFLPSM